MHHLRLLCFCVCFLTVTHGKDRYRGYRQLDPIKVLKVPITPLKDTKIALNNAAPVFIGKKSIKRATSPSPSPAGIKKSGKTKIYLPQHEEIDEKGPKDRY